MTGHLRPISRDEVTPAHLRLFVAVLEEIGWECRELDLNLHSGYARVTLHRHDGRWICLFADGIGRVTLERNHRRFAWRNPNRQDGALIVDEFLGRQRCEGVRSGLRTVTNYLADNPAPGFAALPAAQIRRALASTFAGGGQ